jgi:hypothetical protein
VLGDQPSGGLKWNNGGDGGGRGWPWVASSIYDIVFFFDGAGCSGMDSTFPSCDRHGSGTMFGCELRRLFVGIERILGSRLEIRD